MSDDLITSETIDKCKKKARKRFLNRRLEREGYISPLTLESELQADLINQGGSLGGTIDIPVDLMPYSEDIEDQIASRLVKSPPARQTDAFDAIADAVVALQL